MRPRESVEVRGLVKHSDKPGYFAPDNLPEIGQWFYYDIPAMVSLFQSFQSCVHPQGSVVMTYFSPFLSFFIKQIFMCVALFFKANCLKQ